MIFSSRGVESPRRPFSFQEINKNISDIEMGSWISSLLRETLQGADFANDDFMGKSGDIVSILDLIQAMAYYATLMGYSPTWELSTSSTSPTFDDFARRPGIYKRLAKKVENWSTLSGGKKLASVKKIIRIRISDKTTTMFRKPNPLGVFDNAGDMELIFKDNNFESIIYKLHQLGEYPEKDPRFYIHMIYRYYVGEFHKELADDDKVLRFPSFQKIMDAKIPVNCVGSTPSEFRMFLQHARGNTVSAVTLPVPAKKKLNQVVYGYTFESTVPWVPVMRARIFNMFVELSSSACSQQYTQIYPKYLRKGEDGCERGNNIVIDALARSIEMKDLGKTLDGFRLACQETIDFLDNVLSVDSRVAGIYQRCNNHPFVSEGEQLRERLGFLLQDSVRGVFRCIASEIPSFCNDIYTTMGISYVAHEVFIEYCTTKTSMCFKRRDEEVWRKFIIDMRKICCILHAVSRKAEVDEFVQEYGSGDGYLSSILKRMH